MNRAQLLQNFDTLAETPDAVVKLRTFVFDFAVRGRLVEQNPKDTPVEELLKRIAANKERLVKQRKIKAATSLPQIENAPYEIPSSWKWIALGNTGQVFNGNSVSESVKYDLSKVKDGLPFIATKDVGYGRDGFAYENGLRVPLGDDDYKVAHKHSILICAEGGSAGRKMGQTDRDICFGNKLLANEVWDGIQPRFILSVYQSSMFFREAILSLAVQGRLVPTGSRANGSSPALDWRSVTVSEVADHRLGKMLDHQKNRGTSRPYLRNTNVHWFRFELSSIKELRLEDDELENYELRRGDVLICEGGHGIGRTAVWESDETGMIFQKALHRVRPGKQLNSHFFAFCMKVYAGSGILEQYYTGAGIPHFTGQSLARLKFPLPPLAEQQRIVAKVDELLRWCDALEARLNAAQTTASHLLDATLHQILSA